jgi:hypothetical protein
MSPAKNFCVALCACFLASCAGSPPTGADLGPGLSSGVPAWVSDTRSVYPDERWLWALESGPDKTAALEAALTALARRFRLDVESEADAYERYSDAVRNENGESFQTASETREFVRETRISSHVYGLIGVETDFWIASNGACYAIALMNIAECSRRYQALIGENEGVIVALLSAAAAHPGSFDAVLRLNLAADTALVNDSFRSILSVLSRGRLPEGRAAYGNAEAVRSLALDAARAILISIHIEGDVDGRIGRAFGVCFADRGFRTVAEGAAAAYILAGSYHPQDMDLGSGDMYYARYTLTAVLRTATGEELLSFSSTGHEGHRTLAEARQFVLRTAGQEVERGFGPRFDAYLESLLK